MRQPGRFRGFLLVSGVLIGTAAACSGLLVGTFFQEHARTHEEGHSAELVLSEAREDLSPEAFEFPPDPTRVPMFEHVLRGLPRVFRIKVYDSRARVLWSNEPRLIGMTFADNPDLVRALAGQVTTVIGPPHKRENLYEMTTEYFSEVYVPIAFPGSERVVGVIEIYKDMTAVVHGVRRIQRLIWVVTGGIGLLLYFCVAFVAWRASVNELRAIRQLEQQNRELVALQGQLVAKERLAAVGQVVVGLHHTIFNPLTGVLGALQMLKREGIPSSQQRQAISDAEGEIRKIERLVRQLAELRQIEGVPYVGGTTMLDCVRSPSSEESERGCG